MTPCKLCRRPAVTAVLDFGEQPLTNRFLRSPDEPTYTHPLAIGVCGGCGTVQLGPVAPAEEVRPRFEGQHYNEPEGHLDDAARIIRRLPGVTPASTVCGLTYKDESTLRRLRALGLARTWRADPRDDLGVDHPLGGVESIQQNLTRGTARRLIRKHGRPDVVVLRHVLEHAHDIHEMLAGLRELVAPGGYLVIEAPDATRPLERGDYSTVWEEHVFYFTPATLRQCLALGGFEVVSLQSYFYTLENSLFAVARPSAAPAPHLSEAEVGAEVRRMRRFIDGYPSARAKVAAALTWAGDATALLGAGHHGAAFVNLLGLGSMIDFACDDDPRKQGLTMPGSGLPIVGTDQLTERDVRLCLMSVRPEIEEAVAHKQRAFTAGGGRLASIFPDSRYALNQSRDREGAGWTATTPSESVCQPS